MPVRSILVINQSREEVEPALESIRDLVKISYATSPEEVEHALVKHQPDAVFSMSQSTFPGSAHRAAVDFPSVRWFHVAGSGYEYIQPWNSDQVTVTNGHGVLAPFLAETVLGAILMLNGNFLIYGKQQQNKVWQRQFFKPLAGQTLLVVGLGAIGSLVAEKAKSQGMRVIATSRKAESNANVAQVFKHDDLSAIVGEADFVSLHLRLTDQTRALFNANLLSRMKKGSFLINTSRGLVVDERALIEALNSDHLAGAYLDVFEQEPLPTSSPLWDMDNLIITPHASDNIVDWPQRCAALFVENFHRWNKGETLLNLVSAN